MVFVTYPVALGALCAVLVGGIAAASLTGHGSLAWVVFPVVAVLAGWFLFNYAKRPGPVPRQRTPDPEPSDEPFEDPVEEADRSAADPIYGSSAPASEGIETPGAVVPPVPAGVPPGTPERDEPSAP